MGYYVGTTVAFSHKGGFWKTRYSYAPTCYATVDNVMISNNKTLDPEGAPNTFFWEHGVNSSHNNFYGEHFESSITVVSNQDPLSVKLFKALSLESDSNDWVGTALTNINPIGAPQNELQSGNIKGFVTKEGNQYTELPRDLVNSNSHIDYVCQLDSIVSDAYLANDWSDLNESFLSGNIVFALDGAIAAFKTNVLTTPPNTTLALGFGSIAVFVNTDGEAYTLNHGGSAGGEVNLFENGFPWEFTLFTFNTQGETYEASTQAIIFENSELTQTLPGRMFIHSYNSDGTITLGFGYHYGSSPQLETFPGLVDFLNSLGPEWSTIQLYSATSPEINGDPMRGDFLHLTLTNNSAEPVETYAINVDFENTTLDSSSKGIAS